MAEVATREGHRWYCDACPAEFDTPYGARAHVNEIKDAYARGEKPFLHFCIERPAGKRDGTPSRWIYVTPADNVTRLGDKVPNRGRRGA